MEVGQLVDYCITYNAQQKEAEKEAEEADKKPKKRKATQADWDAFYGG